MPSVAEKFENATVTAKANVYYDGKVVSHSLLTADGKRKTVGVIFPGSYHFGTDAAELMEVRTGSCTVKLDGEESTATYTEGQAFEVPAKSGFDISVTDGHMDYICTFLD